MSEDWGSWIHDDPHDEWQLSGPEFISKFKKNFKPIKVLGQGAFGCVFEVEEILAHKLKWHYAVKRIPLKKSEKDKDDALREVRALISFDHPGIVRFYHTWIEEPPAGWQREYDELMEKLEYKKDIPYIEDCAFLYIKMDLCQSTLQEWLAVNIKERVLARMKNWFKQLVAAVAYIHRGKDNKGRIHRDLKPSNILFADDNHIKIGDLGLVTDEEISNEKSERKSPSRTIGRYTKRYMAPEQKGWYGYDNKVDVFALGLILAELCVVMTDEMAEKVFDNYRNGVKNDILQKIQEVENFVAWLTTREASYRPTCEQILQSSFLKDVNSEEKPFESEFHNKFEVRTILGHGGFGCVYEARHKVDNIVYAVKRIPIQARSAEKIVCTLASLLHEGIVRYHTSWIESPPVGWQIASDSQYEIWGGNAFKYRSDYAIDSAFFYVQMELCKFTLADWLRDSEGRNITQSKGWLRQIVAAVEYIHEQNLIHRDLKPSNILIAMNGRIKVADMDISAELFQNEFESEEERTTCIGTPMYMSSEQRISFTYTSKTDIFSIGLIFTELCVRMSAEEKYIVFNNMRRGRKMDILEDQADVARFIAWLTKMNPRERPSCAEILQDEFLS